MKLRFPRTILLFALLFACPRLMVPQGLPASEPRLTPSEAHSLLKDLAAQEQEWEQSCRRIAAIYREMAAPSESDSASVRELKHQYARLAENEDRAAAAAKKLATHHARLAALLHDSADSTKTRNLYADSAYRR